MSNEKLSDIVSAIIASADEVKSKKKIDSQDFGQLLAYAETLSIIRDACNPADLEDVGLNFDIDKRYLCK